MRRTLSLSLAALVVLAAAGAGLWYMHVRRTPLYALRELGAAVEARDQLAFEAHFDTKRVAQSVADELVTSAVTDATRSAQTDNPFGAIGAMLGAQILQGMKPMLAAMIEESIMSAVRKEPPKAANQATTNRFLTKPPDLRRFREGFKGIESVEQRENLALVRVRMQPEDRDSVMVFTVRMERSNGVWKVVGIEQLAGQLAPSQPHRPSYAERLENAYVASMKSDLRNLITAEEAYFADSVKYTTDLGSWYSTTTGVTGPTITLTADGFTAWVGSLNTSKTCAIYVGAARLAPAIREGEPRCAEGPPRSPLPARPAPKTVSMPNKQH
ncbi:MAG TPA: DUF2939 domain-containing protein [Gemmatimonadales bacterium]|jgi:hypothetical protein|nr:DUF2939 domain-containing protein [Gemmatimonadales bacterium]